MKQKRTVLALHLLENILPRIFFKFSAKRVLCPLGYIFNKVNGVIVQKQYEVELVWLMIIVKTIVW